MATAKNFPVFDCDSHVVEPPAVWDEYVPARERAWEALELMAKYEVPEPVRRDMLGNNARRLYGIEPLMRIKERIADYQPAILPW